MNAYTEAANGLAKIANRNGRGYSFEAIRAKIIYGPTVKRGLFGEEFDVKSPETDHGKEGERVQ